MGPEREIRGSCKEEKEIEKYREKIRGVVGAGATAPPFPTCVCHARRKRGKDLTEGGW